MIASCVPRYSPGLTHFLWNHGSNLRGLNSAIEDFLNGIITLLSFLWNVWIFICRKKNSLYVKKEEDSEGIKSYLSKFCAVFFFFLYFHSHGFLFRPFEKALSTNHVQVSSSRQLAFFRCNQMLAWPTKLKAKTSFQICSLVLIKSFWSLGRRLRIFIFVFLCFPHLINKIGWV